MSSEPCAADKLLERAAQWTAHRDWRALNAETLARITGEHGIDFATALLYSRLRNSEEHGAMIRSLERVDDAAPGNIAQDSIASQNLDRTIARDQGFRIGIVPGGLHRESKDSRECLNSVYREMQHHGLATEIIATASFGPLADNARLISEWLAAAHGPTVLVSLSKGGAETKLALRKYPDAFRNVRVWIDASGLLEGSEWVTWLLDRTISNIGARCWAWLHARCGYRFATLNELRRGRGTMLDFDVNIPDHMTAIRMVGFPLNGDLTYRYSKRSHQRLTSRGPSDGMGIMLGDLTNWPGGIYPVWRADHFLRPPGKSIRDFVRRVVHYVLLGERENSFTEFANEESVRRG